MKSLTPFFFLVVLVPVSTLGFQTSDQKPGGFNPATDLLLAQFDCKTDVDDLHTVAALATLLSNPSFAELNFHAVAGTYGIQDGLYVPPNSLFDLAFGDNWSDAHSNRDSALTNVMGIAINTLLNGGDIWIAEAGQSDFSALLVREIQKELPELITKNRIHIVQHSDWNESVTSPESLSFVKHHTDYHKIPDGNAVGNGTPGFRTSEHFDINTLFSNRTLSTIWEHAITISNKYNGHEGRYLNEAISDGGLDFSDLSEVCWMLGKQDIPDTHHFFSLYAQ